MRIPRSKVRVPAVPETAIDRPRLLRRVMEPDWDLVVLQAAGGYGKSVLAAQVAAQEASRTAWLHLSDEEADPARFCAYVIAALSEVVRPLRETELFRPAESASFDLARWLDDFRLFFDELAPSRFRLVLDNFEAVADAPMAATWLKGVMEPGCQRLGLLVTTRRVPKGRIARWTAQQRLLLLGEKELAFTLEEHRLACRSLGMEVPDRSLDDSWSRNQGWCVIAGLGTDAARTGRHDLATEYLEQELIGRLPETMRAFLRDTSVLDVITEAGVLGLGLDAAQLRATVRALAANGIPHLTVEEDAGVRIHPILREWLLGELRDSPQAATLADKAARLLCNDGRYESAADLLLGLGQQRALLDLVVREWVALDGNNWQPRLRAWLEQLDAKWRTDEDFALFYTRVLRSMGDLRAVRGYLDELSASGEPIESWEAYPEIWAHRVFASATTQTGRQYEEAAAEWSAIESRANTEQRGVGERALGTFAIYSLRLTKALGHMQKAAALAPKDRLPSWVSANNTSAVVYTELGRFHEALELYDAIRERCVREEEWVYRRTNIIGAAWVLKELGRFAEAIDRVRPLERPDSPAGPIPETLQPHLDRTVGEAMWHLGRRQEGMERLRAAHAGFLETNRFEAAATAVLIDHWSMLTGEPTSLVRLEDFADQPPSEAHARLAIHEARRAAGQGDFGHALGRLAEARRIAESMPSWRVAACFTEAWVHARTGSGKAVQLALEEGFAILEEIDSCSYGLADPELTAWVIVESATRKIFETRGEKLVHVGLLGHLVEALRAVIEDPERDAGVVARAVQFATRRKIRGLAESLESKSDVEASVRSAYLRMIDESPLPGLHVTMLGPLEVFVPGAAVRFKRKASRRTLELLLLEHPRPVHEERLLEAIWPDADPRRARINLRTALSDLRTALDPYHRAGSPSYVRFEEDHYRLHLPDGSRVDVLEFREGVGGLLKKGDALTGADLKELERALDLYRGELLADAPYVEFAVEPREEVRSLFLEGIAALIRRQTEPGLALLERGLEADPLWSEGMALVLEVLRREGRPLAAVRRYRAFETRLERELGVEPDPLLRREFERIAVPGR